MLKKTPIKVDISLILIAIIGIGLSLTTFFYVKKWEFDLALENKKKQANEHARILRQTFTTMAQLLKSIRALYHVHDHITRKEFTQFLKGELLEQPGLQALQWVMVVPPEQRSTLETKIRTEGINHFRIWEFSQPDHKQEVGIKNVYYPILFVEPIHNNKDHLGYDVSENKILRTALEKALELGQLTTSGVTWIQTTTGKKRGFQVFLPVYQTEKYH
ncbi:conserved hypothetical protein [Beggiatoa sp. PS]|nr:conserved hypothetical protein [Beggiatoa sp. PS]